MSYVLVAGALHAAAVALWHAVRATKTSPGVAPPTSPRAINLGRTPSAAAQRAAVMAARRARSRPTGPIPTPAPAKPPREEPPRGTVIEVAPTPDNVPPAHADYLAEFNARTEHQTRSRHRLNDAARVLPAPAAGANTPPTPVALQPGRSPAARENSGSPTAAAPGAPARQPATKAPAAAKREASTPSTKQPAVGAWAAPAGAAPSRPNLFGAATVRGRGLMDSGPGSGPPPRPNTANGPASPQDGGPGSGSPVHDKTAFGAGSSRGAKPLTMADLVPSVGTLMRMGGGPAPDALEDVDLGESTSLNARAFRYATFFNRIKRSLAQHWRAHQQLQQRDPTGQIYGQRNRTTTVRVCLDPQGEVKKIEVVVRSGTDFLDDEALRAFEAAAPFLHVPPGLLAADGTLTFNFSFVIDFEGHSFFQSPY